MIISRETIRKQADIDAMAAAEKAWNHGKLDEPQDAYPHNPEAQAEYAKAYAEKLAEYGVLAEA